MRGDQRAFDEAVRVALKVNAVFEGAGLALVDVHRDQSRCRLLAQDAPLAPGRETGATQAAQAGAGQGRDHAVDAALSRQKFVQHAVAALGHIAVEADGVVQLRLCVAALDGVRDRGRRCLVDAVLAHHGGGCGVAAADARHLDHAHIGARRQVMRQCLRQRSAPRHRAAQRTADPHRDAGRRCRTVAQHLEVVIEGGDLVDLGQRQPHLGGQRDEQGVGQAVVRVVDAVQVFDQKIARSWVVKRLALQQAAHFGLCLGRGLAALGLGARLARRLLRFDARQRDGDNVHAGLRQRISACEPSHISAA